MPFIARLLFAGVMFCNQQFRKGYALMKKHTLTSLLLLILFTLIFPQLGSPQDGSSNRTCSFQTLNIPGNSADFDTLEAINDFGAMVGTATSSDEQTLSAFLLFDGKFLSFMFPGAQVSAAHDINNQFQIVGEYQNSSGLHGFIVHSGGFRTIDFPGAEFTVAEGINDVGEIVGDFSPKGSPGMIKAFLLHNGKFTTFSFPGSDPGSTGATGINNSGTIVGNYQLRSSNHGFILKRGIFTSIEFPGAFDTRVFKISNEGDVVGQYTTVDNMINGFSFQNGRYTTINQPNSSFNALGGVNDRDQVVGENNIGPFRASCHNVF